MGGLRGWHYGIPADRRLLRVRRGLVVKVRLWVFALLLLLPGAVLLHGGSDDYPWAGVLWTKGAVSVDAAAVTSGTTVLPRDVITTAEGASAWLRFRAPASAILFAETEVAVLPTNSAPGFQLRRGTLILEEKVAEPLQVAVPGGFVLVQGDAQNGAQCELAANGSSATVSVTRGVAEVYAQGAPVILHAGQSARVEAGPQQSGQQPPAGRISREIPQGEIHREGQVQPLPLKLNERINLNDLVQTLQTGRAQITLLDGSTLNVGARSQIKITQHDLQQQQTTVEVVAGEVRASVQKFTATNPKFELRTKSAVIGTIDTEFVAATDDKGTKVCGVNGTTRVQSSDPKITKEVKLHKKQCTFVPYGGAPTDPIYSPGELSSLMSQTTVQTAAGVLDPTTAVAVAEAGGVGAAIAGVVLAPPAATSPTAP